MDSNFFLYLFLAAVVGLIIGYTCEGKKETPQEKFYEVVKWISIVILGLYGLVIVMAFSDGLGAIPYLGGAVWVRGHWRRR